MAEILVIVEHFENKAVNQSVLTEYCNLNKFEFTTVEDLINYTFHVEYDRCLASLLPKIIATMGGVRYIPTFVSENEKKKIEISNNELHNKVCELIEESAIPFTMLDKIGADLGKILSHYIEEAGRTIYNNAMFKVIPRVLHEKFGADFNSKHAADYVKKLHEKSNDTKDIRAEAPKPVDKD